MICTDSTHAFRHHDHHPRFEDPVLYRAEMAFATSYLSISLAKFQDQASRNMDPEATDMNIAQSDLLVPIFPLEFSVKLYPWRLRVGPLRKSMNSSHGNAGLLFLDPKSGLWKSEA